MTNRDRYTIAFIGCLVWMIAVKVVGSPVWGVLAGFVLFNLWETYK